MSDNCPQLPPYFSSEDISPFGYIGLFHFSPDAELTLTSGTLNTTFNELSSLSYGHTVINDLNKGVPYQTSGNNIAPIVLDYTNVVHTRNMADIEAATVKAMTWGVLFVMKDSGSDTYSLSFNRDTEGTGKVRFAGGSTEIYGIDTHWFGGIPKNFKIIFANGETRKIKRVVSNNYLIIDEPMENPSSYNGMTYSIKDNYTTNQLTGHLFLDGSQNIFVIKSNGDSSIIINKRGDNIIPVNGEWGVINVFDDIGTQ